MSIRLSTLSLCLTSLLLGTALAPRATAQVTLKSTLVKNGLTEPLFVVSPPGDTHRLFVVQHAGVIKIIKDGVLLATPFINLDPIITGGSGSNEQGMLGLAFHPDYANNRKFYVNYIDLNADEVIREYLADPGNPDVALTATFTTIFGPYQDPQSNHNGGCLQFGPDGMLYYGLGDGGNGNDQGPGHTEPTGNAQAMTTYFGKMLRFDVGNPPTYVAAGNPFSASAIPLTWSLGWRNPWRFSFDRLTGDMYVGDVGQDVDRREEVDFQPAASTGGENYGWRCMEGTRCTGFTGCTCNAPTLKLPIHEYNTGCTVVGGYVYRGSAIPGFQGHYIFADYCNGRIWSFTYNGSTVSNFTERTSQLDPAGSPTITQPTSFGEDANGELYICDFIGGEVFRIDAVCPTPTTYCVGAVNSTGGGSMIGFTGSGVMADNNLQLTAVGNPPNVFGLFYYGQGTAQAPAYNGFRCIANTFHRLPVIQTDSFGDASWSFDVNAPPAVITAGSTWNFQFFYRDQHVGLRANYSDALSVPFCAN